MLSLRRLRLVLFDDANVLWVPACAGMTDHTMVVMVTAYP
jgi:hypothetical protein